jgi:hypothetical protein
MVCRYWAACIENLALSELAQDDCNLPGGVCIQTDRPGGRLAPPVAADKQTGAMPRTKCSTAQSR